MDSFIQQWNLFFTQRVVPDHFLILITLILAFVGMLNFWRSSSREKIGPEKTDDESLKEKTTLKIVIDTDSDKSDEKSWEKRLFDGLGRTRSEVWSKIGHILKGKPIEDEMIEDLEEVLYTADMSPTIVAELLDKLREKASEIQESGDHLGFMKSFMQDKMELTQEKVNKELYTFDPSRPELKVIMIVGVNGAGKTTTIGKLATKLRSQGAKVVVGACDTFRAAAVEQLEVWCRRAQVDIVKAAEGSDPSGVAYDAVSKAQEVGANYCIIDTAGRLHTKSNLMDELAKTKKVMSKVICDAPHETLLVIDAITGQNALRQAEEFDKSLNLSGLIFTKCDGSSKAGSAVGIVEALRVPIVYIGVGEDVEDLDIFSLEPFLNALLGIREEA